MDKDSEVTSDIITKEDREFIKYYKKEVLPNNPNYKIVRRMMSTGYNMIPDIGQAKLVLEVLVGEDLVTGDKYDIIDTISTSFMVQKSIAEQRLSQMKNLSGREKIEYLIKNQNIISENSPKLIEYKNNGAITNNQLLLEYKPIKMLPGPYKDLTTSQNLAGLDSSITNNSLIIVNKTNSMPPVLYKAENTDLVLYKNQNLLSTPVVNNRVLTDGINKIIRKTDFYVGPDGASSTLPATAYRYLDSKAYVETKKNMTGNLSYFGFKKFDTAYQARDGLQIKYDYYNQNDPYHSWSNAAVRGTFDTLQLYDNTTGKLKVRIPYTFGDTGKDLETFTESYPEYGQGGELQMICLRWDEDLIIKYDRFDILPNPRTDLILKEEIIK
ncbi:hypothetical protein [Fusobacterium polymorphum]|nr:hypothetical protein CA845_12030 [Fusobacterium polymorphum]